MRILHTNMHVGGWGGQANRILVVCKGLSKRGYHVIIAAPYGATLIKRAKEAGLKTFDNWYLPKKFSLKKFIHDIVKITGLIKRECIDIVHTHGSQDSWVASISAKLFGKVKVVRTRHNIFPVKTHIFNKFLYRILTDKLIAISFAVFDVYKKNKVLGSKIDDVEVVYSSIDLEKYEKASIAKGEVEELISGSLESNFLILNIGRLAKEKGQRYLIELVSKIARKIKFKLVILGEGPLYDSLKELTLRLGVQDSVIFGGLRKNVASFLRYSDLFIFTSISEGLGTSLIEAGYFECPVLAFKVGGIGEVVRSGKNGLMVEPGDMERMAFFTETLLLSPRLRRIMGLNGKILALSKFTPEGLVESNIRIYKNLLGLDRS